MVAVEIAAAPSRIVVRRPPGGASFPTSALPAMPASATNVVLRPDSQMASFPYSSRKYGYHAYQAHEKKPQVTNDSTTRSRTAGFRHPYVMPARATFLISPTMP